MDFPLLLTTLLLFASGAAMGKREYSRQAHRFPDFKLNTLHRKPGVIRWLLLALTIVTAATLYLSFEKVTLYRIPIWLDCSLYYLADGSGALLFGLLQGLGRAAWQRERTPETRALPLTAILCMLGLIVNEATVLRYVASQLSDTRFSGNVLLQTSGSSCAAASGANVAGLLGLKYSEREMARLMGTRVCGTSPGAMIRGLGTAGLKARFFEQRLEEPIPLPAILFFHHPGLGPESHAVAAIRMLPDQNTLEVWDPLSGQTFIRRQSLREYWAGRGIAVSRKDT